MAHISRVGPALLVALGTLTGSAAGAASYSGEAPRLGDLVRVDPLGYECVAEAELELAFRATGKSVRLPRTCLPAPCARQLAPAELAEVLGRPADRPLWDDYVARYAQTCVHEALWPGQPPAVTGATVAQGFWAPLIASARLAEAIGLSRPLPGDSVRDRVGPGSVATLPPDIVRPGEGHFPPGPGAPAAEPPAPGITPIPLPPALLLLAGALLALVRRRVRL